MAQQQTYASGFAYTPDGRIEKLQFGNGLWESAKFDPARGQVTELALGTTAGDGSLWKLEYKYGELALNGVDVDAAKNTGNIAKQTLSFNGLAQPLVQTYRYDSLYRLKEARETSGITTTAPQTWKQVFDYDRFGNRTTFQKFVGTTQLTLDSTSFPSVNAADNRLNAGQNYLYDKNGNLTTDAEGRQFIFNGDNKQIEVKNASNVLLGKYFYDGEGKRVKKKTYDPYGVEQEETVFVYDGMGKLVAEYSTKPPPTNPTTSFTATDQLGSPRVITNSLGEVTSRRDFQPFGEELAPDTTYRKTSDKYGAVDSVRQRFTGYQKDEETGLDFAEARMYENRQGRFTAIDPLLASGKSANPQTFNRYAYVLGNPLKYTDPTGLQVGRDNSPTTRNCGENCFGRWNPNTNTAYPTDPMVASVEISMAQQPTQALVEGFSRAVDEIQSGVEKGAANTGINLWNFASQPLGPQGMLIGIPNPFAIEPLQYDSLRAARVGLGVEFGVPAGLGFAGGAFSSGGSSLSVVPKRVPTLDLFGGESSQIAGAINVDLRATSGVRASTEALPFANGQFTDVVASGPRATFLPEASRVMSSGGRLFINSTRRNTFGQLPDASTLQNLGFRVIQENGPLHLRFANQQFNFTTGQPIPRQSVRTTILEKF